MTRDTPIFSAETFRFFRDLSRNNRKPWMDANRERYRRHIVEPFRHLLKALAPAALRLNPEFDTSGRTGGNFSRINRDIRFAKDKSPYRPQMYLFFFDPRVAESGDGQLYVALSADAVTCGFRIYGSGRESRLRRAAALHAAEDTPRLARQARRLRPRYESYWYSSEKGEWTKHPGWPEQREDWKRIKGWVVRRKLKPTVATRASFPLEMARVFREVFPLYRFTCMPSKKL